MSALSPSTSTTNSSPPKRATVSTARTQPVRRWASQNTTEKIVALLLAGVLWFVFGSQREEIQREFKVPIEYHKVSSDWVIEEARDGVVSVTLAGSPQAFNVSDPTSMKISLDISNVREGRQSYSLTSDMLKIPSNLELVKLEPRKVWITAYRLRPRQLRVELISKGSLPYGYKIKSVDLSPRTISAMAPVEKVGAVNWGMPNHGAVSSLVKSIGASAPKELAPSQ